MDDRARDAVLVAAALEGDETAFGRLYDAWYDRVWNVARRVVHDPEVAAEVAQDAFLSAWRNLGTLEDPDAFGGWLLRIARNASFNRRRKETRSAPVDDRGLAMIESSGASPVSAPSGFGVEDRARAVADPERVAGDAELVDLVRESAAAMGERDAEVLDLQLRYGLSPAEIGEVMGMNRNAANQLCHRVRQRFATAVRARVLWRGERPSCEALDAMLRSAGISQFDADAVKIADKHAGACPQCGERRETTLQPAALFAAVPLVAAPVLLKQQTAHALEAAGVNLGGSTYGTDSTGSGDPARSDGARGDGARSDGARSDGGPDGRSHRPRRGRRIAAMAAVAAVVLVAVVVALASRTDDATVDELATGAGSTVSSEATTTVSPSSSSDPSPSSSSVADTPIETLPPASIEPPTSDPSPTTPPPPVLMIDVRLSGSPAPLSYVMDEDAPHLDWRVVGAASVRVEGRAQNQPAVLSEQPSGDVVLCPGIATPPTCGGAPPGSYTYTVRAFDESGAEVGRRSVVLIIGT